MTLRLDGGYTTLFNPKTTILCGLRSVSYTHLDVYKRQKMMSPDGRDFRYAEDVRVKNKIIRETRKEGLLDVYKRQVMLYADLEGRSLEDGRN